MSRDELVLLASRAFALFLISWGLVEITYMPDHLFALFHHLSLQGPFAMYDYWSRYYLILTVSGVVRIIAMFLVAARFWRCEPPVQALFSPQQNNQEPSE